MHKLKLHALNAVRKHSWGETGMTNPFESDFLDSPFNFTLNDQQLSNQLLLQQLPHQQSHPVQVL